MNDYVASLFANSPVLVAADREAWLASCINALQAKIDDIGADQIKDWAAAADEDWWGKEGSFKSMLRPYKVVDGVLSVPVRGVLMHNLPFALFGMATGYEYIVKAFERGVEDPDVKKIAMMIESGGGMVAGAFDATDKLYNLRGTKPMIALVNEHAYSAAYSMASAMDEIVLPRTGGVGSVGVVTAHVSRAEALDKAGVKVTFIYAGAHKVDGNPYEPLSAEVKERMQARIDGVYNIFVSTVARNLGIDADVVRGTEAQTLSAEEAVAIGFAHRVEAIDEALAALGGSQATAGVITMSQEKQGPQATADQASLDAARAEGRKEGAQQERDRIKGIMGCDAATDRRALAFHLSMNTDLSVESATEVLAAAPTEVAPKAEAAATSPFEQAMSNGNPEVSPEGSRAEGKTGEDLINSIMSDYHAVAGKPASTH